MKWDDEFKEKLTRREFFRKAGRAALTAGTAAYVATPVIGLFASDVADSSADSSVVISGGSESLAKRIINTSISGSAVKLAGIEHNRKFMTDHYNTLEEMIKGCTVAVLECGPEDKNITNEAKAYFITIQKMCYQHGKPIIIIEPQSMAGGISDMAIAMLGGFYAITNASKIMKKGEMPRRRFLSGAKALAGLYIFGHPMLGGASMAMAANSLGVSEEKSRDIILDSQAAHFNHTSDQRNVELANRLLALPAKIQGLESKGDYILVNYGIAHTKGIDFYLRHPVLRKIKSGIYSISYGLIDNDTMSAYMPARNGWKKQDIK